MMKYLCLLLASLLISPLVAVAGSSDSFASAVTEGISVGGQLDLSAASIAIDGSDYVRYAAELQLALEGKVADNIALGGRVAAYKYWGDFNSTFDDTLRAERAYLNWWSIGGSNFDLSLGRRPLFYGTPQNRSADQMHIGTPYGNPADLNLDGLSLGYDLNSLTGVPGMKIRLCYGKGIESEWSNEDRFKDNFSSYLDESWLAGMNLDLYNDEQNLIQLNLFRAIDVTSGVNDSISFQSQYAALFAPTLYQDVPKFPSLFMSVSDTSNTKIGDINLLGINFLRKESRGFTWFASAALSQLKSNGKAGVFGGLGSDAVYQAQLSSDSSEILMVPVAAENDETHQGYGFYAGFQVPGPWGRFGLEYNYGSRYWTPFTLPQDDVLGSKLDTRGQATEGYYLVEIGRKARIKIGGIYYDYSYTGSGSPVGEPKKVSEVKAGSAYALAPPIDTAWTAYIKFQLEF